MGAPLAVVREALAGTAAADELQQLCTNCGIVGKRANGPCDAGVAACCQPKDVDSLSEVPAEKHVDKSLRVADASSQPADAKSRSRARDELSTDAESSRE